MRHNRYSSVIAIRLSHGACDFFPKILERLNKFYLEFYQGLLHRFTAKALGPRLVFSTQAVLPSPLRRHPGSRVVFSQTTQKTSGPRVAFLFAAEPQLDSTLFWTLHEVLTFSCPVPGRVIYSRNLDFCGGDVSNSGEKLSIQVGF